MKLLFLLYIHNYYLKSFLKLNIKKSFTMNLLYLFSILIVAPLTQNTSCNNDYINTVRLVDILFFYEIDKRAI